MYYLVIINPNIHLSVWGSLKLIMAISEAQHVLFYDVEINNIFVQEISDNEYKSFKYCLN